ncbi:MAG: M20/M25/M40 family metallo-hydrolase [Anaerolineales bacterium]|nr:M20/M25/M40 family metallo-hydrolase [Anaerolineales bacterium]
MVNRDRLVEEFLQEVKIGSFSGEERQFADRLTDILESLGFRVEMDSAHTHLGGDCGNLICTHEGSLTGVPCIFFSAHMDTIIRGDEIVPMITNGVIHTGGKSILGADDKASIAAIVEAMRVLQERGLPHGDIQLIFTVMEQRGLQGARYLDYSKVRSEFGFNLDSRGDLGFIINQGSYEDKFTIKFEGKSAHFYAAPNSGIDAIKMAGEAIHRLELGTIDEDTSVNIGIIRGGEVTNVVPALVEMWGEVRTQYHKVEMKKQEEKMLLSLKDTAQEYGGKVEFETWRVYDGFHLTEQEPVVRISMDAWRRLGRQPGLIPSRGGGDVNIFVERGFPCITPNCGYYESASVDEHVPIDNLVDLARYILALVGETASQYSDLGEAIWDAYKSI